VQSAEKDNHTMKLKLQEMVQHVNDSSNNKTHTNSRLDQTNQELDEATRHFTLESDEQNRRIGVLHQELKELQDKINNNNHKGSLMGNKIKDLSETQYRVESEQSESILKLKNEHERLKTENNDIHFKVSK
jgi:methyl-accepting chemotaxis protein